MALDQVQQSICAQNSANVAATLLAAMISRSETPPDIAQVVETFDKLRAHVLAGTIAASELALVAPAPVHQNAAYPYPQPPQNTAPPFPQPASQPAPGPTPTCNHGLRVFKQGTSSKGPWRGWMCPQPKDAPDKCSAVFL